ILASKYPEVATAFIVNPRLTPAELLEYILGELEISCFSTTKPARLQALHGHLLETKKKGGTTALILDEAHLMTVELLEEVRLLGNLDTHTEKLLQIILSGQPEMGGVLTSPELVALRQRVSGVAQLRPFNFLETREYMTRAVRAAGYTRKEALF